MGARVLDAEAAAGREAVLEGLLGTGSPFLSTNIPSPPLQHSSAAVPLLQQ